MQIVILGGGISGLSLAWYLQEKYKNKAQITILEKSNHVGGWIRSTENQGFLFEQGPRSCRPFGSGVETLALLDQLGLREKIILADPSAQKRYLYRRNELYQIPNNFLDFITKPSLWHHLACFLKELFIPVNNDKEENIREFFVRRFNVEIADDFIDPFISGIFAGDIGNLSLKSCFPQLYEWEKQSGSIIKGALLSKKIKSGEFDKSFIRNVQRSKLFSLQGGLAVLIEKLAERLSANIKLEAELHSISFHKDRISLELKTGKIETDYLFSTIPSMNLAPLLQSHDDHLAKALHTIPLAPIATVNVGYKNQILKNKGFGYLIPSKEKEKVLGVLWDSLIFPQNNRHPKETRLTVMIGGSKMKDFSHYSEQEFINFALDALKRQMDIDCVPDAISCHIAHHAIPQYLVGHSDKVAFIEGAAKELSPRFTILGNSFYGVSVNDCIANARKVANNGPNGQE